MIEDKGRDRDKDNNGHNDDQENEDSLDNNNQRKDFQTDLDDTIDMWLRQRRTKFTLWGTVDRWGPLVISIITLILVAIIGWMYSSSLAAVRADVHHLEYNQNNIMQRLNVKEMKDQILREDLLKKGLID